MGTIFEKKGRLKTSFEGLMVGNGTIGGLLYGDRNLILSLDLVSLWDKRLPKEFYDKDFNYPYMVECAKSDYKRLFELFDACYLHPFPTKVNAARLVFDEAVDDQSVFRLSFDDGRFFFENGENSISGYVDAYQNVLVMESSKKLSYAFLMSSYLNKAVASGGLGYKEKSEGERGAFRFVKQPMYGRHFYMILVKETRQSDGSFLYLMTIAQDKSVLSLKRELNRYESNRASFYQRHLSYYRDYYSRGKITTPDPEINDLYVKGLYFFSCNSRGKYPMTLQGVWTQNNDSLPPWKSDLHNDINIEMTYDAYFKTGHEKEGKVLVDYLYSKRKAFRRFARGFMKSKGLLIPGVMSQDGLPLGGWPQYALSPAVSIWILKVFDDYYAYYPSIDFLKKRAYPFFRDTEACLRKYLHLNANGHLELDFHSSPEFYENDPRSLFEKQTNFELTMLRFLYETLVRYSRILGKNPAYYETRLGLLDDYYRNGNEELMISKDEEFSSSHRHFSHMLMYKNLKLVDPFLSREAIQRDIDRLVSYSYKEWVGFSFVEAAGLYSYVFDGENAYRQLKIFSDAFVHPNGFHMNCDYKHLGYSELTCYVMTLEANVGFVSSLADMMVFDCFDRVILFPAVPKEFQERGVSFEKLHLRNDIVASAKMERGKVVSFSFESKKPFSLNLLNNLASDFCLSIDGVRENVSKPLGSLIAIKAKRTVSSFEKGGQAPKEER